MSTDRDTTRIVRSWLEEGVTALPDRVLDQVLDQLPTTSQRRSWWPARRFKEMNTPLRIAIAAAAVVVVAVVGVSLMPRQGGIGGPGASSTPSPTASPLALHDGPLAAGPYIVAPFAGPDCSAPPLPGCSDAPADDTLRFTFTVPDGWAGAEATAWLADGGAAPPDGAWLLFGRGGWLLTDPCQNGQDPDIPVGPSVVDFAGALASHPMLEVTAPIDVTLAGYSGRYMELQVPSDISGCDAYRPWEPGIYAQGPSERWHLWILDVRGSRVLIQSTDYAATSAQRRAELGAIVDSIQIQP